MAANTMIDEPELVNFNTPRDNAPLRLDKDLSAAGTTVYLNQAIKDKSGTALTGKIVITVKTDDKFEKITIPAAGMSATGVCTGCIRGGVPSGLDIDAQDTANYAIKHNSGDEVTVTVDYSHLLQIYQWIKGVLASGGNLVVVGDETNADKTYSYKDASGIKGLVRINDIAGTPKAQFSNNGTLWVDFDSAGVGVIVGGDGIVLTVGNTTISIDLTDTEIFISAHATYTPAFLTGGGAATTNMTTWNGTTDGTFEITIDGVLLSLTGLNFSGDADTDAVALNLQTVIRVASGNLETCVWDTDHFIISSVDTTSSSAITVTSAEGTGTDISGAGATTYMDCETAVGTVTNKVINPAADAGQAIVLDANGLIDKSLIEVLADVTATATEINKLDGAGATVTAVNLDTLTDGSNADALHEHNIIPNAFKAFTYRQDTTRQANGTYVMTFALGDTGFQYYKFQAAIQAVSFTSSPAQGNSVYFYIEGLQGGEKIVISSTSTGIFSSWAAPSITLNGSGTYSTMNLNLTALTASQTIIIVINSITIVGSNFNINYTVSNYATSKSAKLTVQHLIVTK